jgi:hypothetical protein
VLIGDRDSICLCMSLAASVSARSLMPPSKDGTTLD